MAFQCVHCVIRFEACRKLVQIQLWSESVGRKDFIPTKVCSAKVMHPLTNFDEQAQEFYHTTNQS